MKGKERHDATVVTDATKGFSCSREFVRRTGEDRAAAAVTAESSEQPEALGLDSRPAAV